MGVGGEEGVAGVEGVAQGLSSPPSGLNSPPRSLYITWEATVLHYPQKLQEIKRTGFGQLFWFYSDLQQNKNIKKKHKSYRMSKNGDWERPGKASTIPADGKDPATNFPWLH